MFRTIIFAIILTFALKANSQSLCDKYTAILGTPNNFLLVQTVINATLASATADPNTARYFDGTFPSGSPDFLTTPTALNTLRSHLVEFFGIGLNCTDGSTGAYQGADLASAHAALPIGITQFNSFNQQIINILNTTGVQEADLEAILALLNSFKGDICNQPDCTGTPNTNLCDKYSIALNLVEYDLVSTVISGVLANITAAVNPLSTLLRFFNGSTGSGSVNFLAPSNSGALNTLVAHLIQFFGSALGCSATNYPTYAGQTLTAAHAGLPITQADFDLFNQVVIGVLQSAGVVPNDLAAVLALLDSTQSQVCTLCVAPSTSTGAGTTAAAATTAAGASTAAAATTAAGASTAAAASTAAGASTAAATASSTGAQVSTSAAQPIIIGSVVMTGLAAFVHLF